MVSKAAQELGRKGGSVSSERKAEAARRNASLPRKNKIKRPSMSKTQLLEYAALFVEGVNAKPEDMMYVDGVSILELLRSHLGIPDSQTVKDFVLPE